MYMPMTRFSLSVVGLLALLGPTTTNAEIKYPVILVPGDGGSQIQVKFDHSKEPQVYCQRESSEFFTLWLSLRHLLPYFVECFIHNLQLHYDAKTRTTHSSRGVTTRIPGWGQTETIDWLDTSHVPRTQYFNELSAALERAGYIRGLTLRGAPYDFRKAPNEMQDLYLRFKYLIEETYRQNNGEQVVVIAHSLGTIVTLYFFNNHVTQGWKDRYIRAFVTLSAPWGGAVKPLLLLSTGYNFALPASNAALRPIQRGMPSTAWLMPSPAFWDPEEPLVQTHIRTYTVNDYQQFFEDIDFPDGWEMRKDTQGLIADFAPPRVDVHCLHGTGVATAGSYIFTDVTWPDGEPTNTRDDGDGSVNIRSLRGCLRWNGSQPQSFVHREYPGVTHMSIMSNSDVMHYIITSVLHLKAGPLSGTTPTLPHSAAVLVGLSLFSLFWTLIS